MSDQIKRYRGDTYPEIVTITDGGVAMDITGATVVLTLDYDTPVSITATITDAVNGVVKFDFLATQVADVGRFTYDVEVTYSDGTIATHARDEFTLLDDVKV